MRGIKTRGEGERWASRKDKKKNETASSVSEEDRFQLSKHTFSDQTTRWHTCTAAGKALLLCVFLCPCFMFFSESAVWLPRMCCLFCCLRGHLQTCTDVQMQDCGKSSFFYERRWDVPPPPPHSQVFSIVDKFLLPLVISLCLRNL